MLQSKALIHFFTASALGLSLAAPTPVSAEQSPPKQEIAVCNLFEERGMQRLNTLSRQLTEAEAIRNDDARAQRFVEIDRALNTLNNALTGIRDMFGCEFRDLATQGREVFRRSGSLRSREDRRRFEDQTPFTVRPREFSI